MTVERKPSVMGAVLGDYRITGALGGGGMGAVFSATHATTGARAAVKLLRKELTDNAELVERFFNEARAATRIHHPGIIEVYDFGYAADGRAFLAMELLEGTTLRARIAQAQQLPEAQAVAIARGIADALAAAHDAGIIHRDLKPDNVFLVAGERVKILDFGIAKLLDRSGDEASRTRTGSLIGTPVYMAPEQARAAGSIDPRADLYSLGCILYEMVTGAPPFAGNVGELLAAHMFTEPVPARSQAPISVALDALITQLLAKEPADRPSDARAVVGRLDRMGQTTATTATTATISRSFDDSPPVALAQKRSAMPIIAAVATVAIAGAALFFVFGRGSADDAPPTATPAPAKAIAADPPPVVVTPIPAPTVTPVVPAPAPPGPPPVIVVKKPVVKRPIDHVPTAEHSTGPVTMPEARVEPPPARPTGPLVTPEGAPLSAAP